MRENGEEKNQYLEGPMTLARIVDDKGNGVEGSKGSEGTSELEYIVKDPVENARRRLLVLIMIDHGTEKAYSGA